MSGTLNGRWPHISPRVCVVVPCHNEAGFIDQLFGQLLPATASVGWTVVAVNDASTDATAGILADAAGRNPGLTIVSGHYGSPGGARSAGVAVACSVGNPDWIITLDADVDLAPGWVEAWKQSLDVLHPYDWVGAVNGVEVQDHLFASFPYAASVSASFGKAIVRSENLVGITNLNGVNHAVRTAAYLTAGPYVQPTSPGASGPINLAGEDWDLGVRLRLAGYSVGHTQAAVMDRGRRLLANVHAYVSGEAYEGAFLRVIATDHPQDVSADEAAVLADTALDRSLRHFFLKPILAGAVALDQRTGLSPATLMAMHRWMQRWPGPSFAESRNGFMFGRLARFADAFASTVRLDLGLSHVEPSPTVTPAFPAPLLKDREVR